VSELLMCNVAEILTSENYHITYAVQQKTFTCCYFSVAVLSSET